MAQKIVTIYTDDLTGEESAEVAAHSLSVDGVSYEIDLSPDSYDKLLDALGPFLKTGRKVAGRRKGASSRVNVTEGPSAEDIRAWARENGFDVSARGRVRAEVRQAYEAAR